MDHHTKMDRYTYDNLLCCKYLSKKETIIAGHLLSMVLPCHHGKYSTFLKSYLDHYDKSNNFFYLKYNLNKIIEGCEETKVYCLYTIFQRIDFLDKKNYKFIMKMLEKGFLQE